mgnify:CR=1 FL=1
MFLAISLITVGIWGLTQYQARRNWEIQAENQYQRAFQDLSYNIDSIENLSTKALVVNSPRLVMQIFSDIWRHTFSCQQSLGQLPLTNLDLEKTESFLSNMSAYTYRIAQKRVDGNALSEKDWQGLRDLAQRCRFISEQLRKMQAQILTGRQRWLEVGRNMSAQAGTGRREQFDTNSLTKSFMMLEDGMKRFPDADFEGSVQNFKERPMGLSGKNISLKEAATIAKNFIGVNRLKGKQLSVIPRLKLPVPIYTVNVLPRNNAAGEKIYMDISRKGGRVLWMLSSRLPETSTISQDKAEEMSRRFLKQKNFPDILMLSAEKKGNIYFMTFATRKKNVIIYPESVKMQIAADNGQILGFEAINYYTFKKSNRNLRPVISKQTAQRKVNPHVKVSSVNLAVILGNDFNEKLCYEIKGKLNQDKFMLYINAVSGLEEKVRRVTDRGTEEL